MKNPHALRALSAALILVAMFVAPAAWALPEIVQRAIEHHGGDLYRNSETALDLCSKSGCFQVKARVEGDSFDYTVTRRTSQGERRVVYNDGAVELYRDGVRMALATEKEQPQRDWVMARVYFCFLPYRLADPSVRYQDLGLVDWDGKRLHKVKVTFEPGSSTDASDEYMYWFDPDSGRVELFAYSYDDNGGGIRFRRAINHRRIGGLLFFDQENLGVEGPYLSVDAIDPDYVRSAMREISTVRLESIKVRELTP